MVVELAMTIMNELRQYVGCLLVAGDELLLLFELLAQGLGLEFQLLAHRRCLFVPTFNRLAEMPF